MDTKNRLTVTNGIRTIEHVDATGKKLVERMRQLEAQRWRIDRELRSLRTALDVAGIKPPSRFPSEGTDPNESEYALNEPFRKLTLADTCDRILKDYTPEWLTKNQVEYLATRGGYDFSTKDSANSVDVTLRRMAAAGKCEAERVRGSRGNKYRWMPEPKEDEVKT